MSTRVIAISGKSYSGKDSVARILNEIAGSVNIPLAKKLKEAVCDVQGVPPEYMATPEGRDRLRPVLIEMGRQWRELDPYVWSGACIREIGKAQAKIITVSDLRFFNELQHFYEAFGVNLRVIRVSSDETVRAARMGPDRYRQYRTKGIYDDQSETQLDYLDPGKKRPGAWAREALPLLRSEVTVLVNNGDLKDLENQVIDWWVKQGPPVATTTPKQHEKITACREAAYRMARQIGPEVRLLMPDFF